MKLGLTVSGLAARIAAARVERMRNEIVRAALAELAWRASTRQGVSETSEPDVPASAANPQRQRS